MKINGCCNCYEYAHSFKQTITIHTLATTLIYHIHSTSIIITLIPSTDAARLRFEYQDHS